VDGLLGDVEQNGLGGSVHEYIMARMLQNVKDFMKITSSGGSIFEERQRASAEGMGFDPSDPLWNLTYFDSA
jgi:hypothetical protein